MNSRERLVEAAAALLQRDGFSAMSPAAVQQRAGVGQGSMYHHFAGKAELAQVALGRSAQALLAAAEECLDQPGTPQDRVVAYLERERDPLLGCPVGRLAQDRGVVDDPQLREPVDQLFVALQQRIAAVLAEDEAVDRPADLAATVVAVVQGGYVLARAAGSREPFDRAVAGACLMLRATGRNLA